MPVDVTTAVAHVGRVGGGDDGMDAENLLRFASVDADNLRVRVLAAQDRTVQLVFEHQVDAIDALADDPLDAAHASRAAADNFQFSFGHDDGLLRLTNPKFESRNPKEIRKRKMQNPKRARLEVSAVLSF